MQLRPIVRSLLKTPRETALAVLALGAGIGLTATLFSIVKGVVWNSLPVPHLEQLVRIDTPAQDLPNYVAQQTKLVHLAGIAAGGVNCDVDGSPRRLQVGYVSPVFFETLGVQPLIGVTRPPDDGTRIAVLSYAFWQSAYRGDSRVLGRELKVDGQPVTIAGVMAAGFSFPRSEDLWTTWEHSSTHAAAVGGRGSSAFLIGRLKEGATVEQARAEVNVIAKRARSSGSGEAPIPDVGVTSYADSNVKGEVRVLLTALLVCCFFVLLIACANVANLSLARAARRLHELGLRSALGARRGQLISVLLTESLILAVCGAAAGVAQATAGIRLFVAELQMESALTGGMPGGMQFEVDGIVLLFVSLLAIATALVSGLVPALRVTGMNLESLIRAGSSAITLRSGRFGKLLIHVQLGASVLLLVGTGLMAAMWSQLGSNVAYDPSKIVTARLEFSETDHPTRLKRKLAFDAIDDELRSAPALAAAALTTAEHIERSARSRVVIEGRVAEREGDASPARWQAVTPRYFEVFQASLRSGRLLDASDMDENRSTAVVNQSFARRHWPGSDAVGQRFRLVESAKWITVAGVVDDIGSFTARGDERPSAFYVPLAQVDAMEVSVVARSHSSASTAVPALRDAVRRIVNYPLFQVHTGAEIMEMEAVGLRVPALLFAACGFSGLLLSAIGTYGVLSLATRQRTREIGIRLALGATPKLVLKTMMLQGVRQVAVGVGVGFALSLILTRVLASLFGSLQWQLGVNLAVIAIVATVGLAAVAAPAMAASRVEPQRALRD